VLGEITLRPFSAEDEEFLESWRIRFFGPSAEFRLPFGWQAPGVDTAIASINRRPFCALTANRSAYIGPLVRSESASGPEVIQAIYALERALTYDAQIGGAVDAYLSAPLEMTKYHEIIEKFGYTPLPPRAWFWRPLSPTLLK